jgi:quercetin dioxygenase-like cupin family protein
MGLSLLYATVLKEFRILERTRLLLWNEWWTFDNVEKAPYRTPTKLEDAAVLTTSADGTVQLIISPSTAPTFTLHVSLLTLQPGCEIPSCKAGGVEFFYCLAGQGIFSQQGVADTANVTAGDAFVVDPGSMRWIANKTSNTELVLLRATDGGSRYNRGHLDHIRMDPNRKTSTMERLQEGYKQVRILAKDYAKSNSNSVDAVDDA